MSFDAYYYSFEPTGNAAIDSVLEIVAQAGHGFHHTEDWRERYNGLPSYEEQIQIAANKAALSIEAPVFANAAPGHYSELVRIGLKLLADGADWYDLSTPVITALMNRRNEPAPLPENSAPVELPPLPKASVTTDTHIDGKGHPAFTADQMREYARAAIAQRAGSDEDVIGDFQAEARQEKLDDFIASAQTISEYSSSCQAINPPVFPKYPNGLCVAMSPESLWDYACLTGWRVGHFSHPDSERDAARLDFVLDNSAFICTIDAGMYQLMTQDEDEDYHVVSGDGEAFKTKRGAVDAAIAAHQGEKGGA